MTGKVMICGVNTSRLKVLKNDETMELLKRSREGDVSARDELIEGNLRLVLSVIQKFINRGENADDLFQVGCIGLMKAIDNFDTSLQVRFSTYGVPMIIGEIRRYLRDNNSIRVSRSLRDLAYRAMKTREKLMLSKNGEVTNADIAKELGVDVFAVDSALEAVSDPVSIYEPVFKDGGEQVFLLDQISDPKDSAKKWTEQLALRQALTKLTKREYNIIALRYFSGKTQMEIAKSIGISQAQVSRLEKGALDRMKKMM